MVVDKKSAKIICTDFTNGKRHDFRLFKESNLHIHPAIEALADSGDTGLNRYHAKKPCFAEVVEEQTVDSGAEKTKQGGVQPAGFKRKCDWQTKAVQDSFGSLSQSKKKIRSAF